MTTRRFALAWAFALVGCATIPDLTYDDASVPPEAGVDAPAPDASTVNNVDADAAVTTVDSATPLTCDPSHPPDGATQCCSGVPCVDRQGQGCNCVSCLQQKCTGGKWCCVNKNGDLSCKVGANNCN